MSGSFHQLLTDATTRAHHVSVMHAFSGKKKQSYILVKKVITKIQNLEKRRWTSPISIKLCSQFPLRGKQFVLIVTWVIYLFISLQVQISNASLWKIWRVPLVMLLGDFVRVDFCTVPHLHMYTTTV